MTFNHGVEGSSPSALTKQNQILIEVSKFPRNRPCLHRVCKSIAALTARTENGNSPAATLGRPLVRV